MTSDKGGRPTAQSHSTRAKVLVVAALVGALVFGLYLGYLAWANDSFPSQERPFGDYASVTSTFFNGTEFAFNLRWDNDSYLPLYAQLTSPATDSANTPVCDVGLSSVKSGQTIFMPFTIRPAAATLTNVDLSIAVRSVATGGEFTIVYSVASIKGTNVVITPSDISCQQPPGTE
jgi:hypothetical protein